MKIIFSILFTLTTAYSFAQVDKGKKNPITSQCNSVAYRLFPTQNIWTFIKLDTRNGQMWQVQFDVKGSSRFVTHLSFERLVTEDKEVNDRFTLYPTDNMYNFILLDQYDGRTWQVQWSTEPENRVVMPIE